MKSNLKTSSPLTREIGRGKVNSSTTMPLEADIALRERAALVGIAGNEYSRRRLAGNDEKLRELMAIPSIFASATPDQRIERLMIDNRLTFTVPDKLPKLLVKFADDCIAEIEMTEIEYLCAECAANDPRPKLAHAAGSGEPCKCSGVSSFSALKKPSISK